MEPIIEFENFTFKYRSQMEPTLRDINLKIYPGEKVLIIGPSGSGKSTLSNCINGLIPFSYEGDSTGTLKIEGKDPKKLGIFGLSYVKLGQPSTELSGGEAQRIKLATELSKRGTGKTIYVLDEPTTGLHFADVHKLVEILRKLSDGGNTVVVIEHNLDVIKTADYIIDMGPEGGDGGGTVIAQGTPEEICKVPESYTGQFLKPYLESKNV